ncbi:hypothetical protein PM082_016295 [Marasmius tenuissimus]|nr:hypothetical protein PM082_016295 [Marasmius tenuissimus]
MSPLFLLFLSSSSRTKVISGFILSFSLSSSTFPLFYSSFVRNLRFVSILSSQFPNFQSKCPRMSSLLSFAVVCLSFLAPSVFTRIWNTSSFSILHRAKILTAMQIRRFL